MSENSPAEKANSVVSILLTVEKLMNTRFGNVFLVVAWPILAAGIGLPTGIAQQAVAAWEGKECCPCEVAAPATLPAPTPAPVPVPIIPAAGEVAPVPVVPAAPG
jgi:hypothetical protein